MTRALHWMASLRITVPALVVLAAFAIAGRVWQQLPAAWMALPTLVLACNLLAALAKHPRLRAQRALASFHWALIGVCVLVAVSVLARFEGEVEIVEGEAFDPAAVRVTEVGPLASSDVEGVDFQQGDLSVGYLPGLRRQATATSARIAGVVRPVTDHEPIEVGGYRLSPTSNKGFAVLLSWRGADGDTVRGAIHLPSYPVYEWRQENTWRTPAGEMVDVAFRPSERAPVDTRWTLSRTRAAGTIVLRSPSGDHVVAVAPEAVAGAEGDAGAGTSIPVRGGTLVIEGVRLWIGYRIERDPALPWLFIVAALGIAAFGWHVLAPGVPPPRTPVPRRSPAEVSRVPDRA